METNKGWVRSSKIHLPSVAHSGIVQRMLFRMGCRWTGPCVEWVGGKKPKYENLSKPYIFINSKGEMLSSSSDHAFKCIQYKELTIQEVTNRYYKELGYKPVDKGIELYNSGVGDDERVIL